MIILILSIVIIVGIIVWAIMAFPKSLPSTDNSVNAINNVYHWFGSKLGPHWPLVLSIILILMMIILSLLITNLSSIHIDDNIASIIVKYMALMTIGIITILTWQWRTKYIQDPSAEYYIELAIIVILLGINGYLVYYI